jgi:branched-subunit amino acid ABC-type transport system permease component
MNAPVLMDYALSSLSAWGSLALFSLALALVWRLAGQHNFALAAQFSVSALSFISLKPVVGFYGACFCALLISIGLGISLYVFLRYARGTTQTIMGSFGALLFIDAGTAWAWGPNFRFPINFPLTGIVRLGSINGISLSISKPGIIAVVSSIICAGIFTYFLARTRLGRSVRATIEDRALAQAIGIQTRKLEVIAYLIASILVAWAGILNTLAAGAATDDSIGLELVLYGLVAIVIAGRRTILGALIGAAIVEACLGVAQQVLGQPWQDPIAFGLLLLILAVRPSGLFNAEPIPVALRRREPPTYTAGVVAGNRPSNSPPAGNEEMQNQNNDNPNYPSRDS